MNLFINSDGDGKNGWYKKVPLVSLHSSDRETYTKSRAVKSNGGIWKEYDGPVSVSEGHNVIEAKCSDSRGLTVSCSEKIKVDSVPPSSELRFSSERNADGWFNEKTVARIEAQDSTSGVERILVGGKEFSGALVYDREGVFSVSFCAEDSAGNTEAVKCETVRLDFTPPAVRAVFSERDGAAFLELDSHDALSGVSLSEYSINGKEAVPYEHPVMLFPGFNEIRFRSKDRAGNISGWKTVYRRAETAGNASVFADIRFDGKKAGNALHFSTGVPLVFSDEGLSSEYTAEEVPLELASLEYIPLPQEGAGELSFYVSADCRIYLCVSDEEAASIKESGLNLEKAFDASVNRELFGRKCGVYFFDVVRGKKTVIKNMNGKLPLVLADKK